MPFMTPDNVKSVLFQCEKLVLNDILFKIAVYYAGEGFNVWFISPEPFKTLPDFKPVDKETLKLITFLYLKDQKDLINHLNGIHLWHKFPKIIILNGLENYCPEDCGDFNVAFTIASLLDAASVCGNKHTSKQAYLLVAESKSLNAVSDLYFSKILRCEEEGDVVDRIVECFRH